MPHFPPEYKPSEAELLAVRQPLPPDALTDAPALYARVTAHHEYERLERAPRKVIIVDHKG